MVSNDDFDGKATHLICFYLHINFEQKYPKPAIVHVLQKEELLTKIYLYEFAFRFILYEFAFRFILYEFAFVSVQLLFNEMCFKFLFIKCIYFLNATR